jgi:hypothetical protein
MASRIRFALDIPKDEYLRYYRGEAQAVQVTAEDGRRIRFPAINLRPFVTKDGVRGRFEITLDWDNRLLDIRRL